MLKNWLKPVIPQPLLEGLTESLGWQIIGADGVPVDWELLKEERDEMSWDIKLKGKGIWNGITAEMKILLNPQFHSAVINISLENTAKFSSPPISAIQPLSLHWSNPNHPIYLRYMGGGLTYGFYPSPAFKEHTFQLLNFASEPMMIESGPDGRSSNKYLPFLAFAMNGAGLISAMEWSAQWYMGLTYPFVSLIAGIPVSGLVLDGKETLTLPPLHLIFFTGDLDEGSNAFRRYLYKFHCPRLNGNPPLPPVSYDHWFGIHCDYDEELLKRQADRCAELGVEYFVLDAGWYAGCGPGGEFSRGVGNWLRIDEKKFPSGIESLAEYVRSKGMKFGMWFEVERAHRESDIVREHPDWFIDIGEEYLHLNLAKKEAQDGIIEIISQWVRKLDLKWIRYDYNIGPKPFWEHIDETGKIQFKYMQGLYRVLDELMKRHPDLLIECCASGGRRIDLGTLKRAHTIWISDHTEDPHICRFMQSGGNRFLPANLLNSAVPNYLSSKERKMTIDFLSRMVGAFSIDGDVASWSEEQSAEVKNLIKIYKRIRHLLVQDFHPLTPQPCNPDEGEVISFVSEDKEECVIFAFRMPNEPMKRRVELRGILPHMDYYVRDLLNPGKPINLVKGDALMREGLELDLTPDCALYYLSIKVGDF